MKARWLVPLLLVALVVALLVPAAPGAAPAAAAVARPGPLPGAGDLLRGRPQRRHLAGAGAPGGC
jgi:hypothetical protein